MNQRTDEDLMHRLQRRRDEDAFNLLFARYRRPIISYLYRLVGNSAEAESLAQETFLRLLEKAGYYKFPKRFSTWFYTIARNLATDFLKKKRAVVVDGFQSLSEAAFGPVRHVYPPGRGGQAPEAEAQASREEELALLARAMSELPLAYREVMVLRSFQGLSYREIAEIVGCPESTARSRMNYALDCLRRFYRRGGGKTSETSDKPED